MNRLNEDNLQQQQQQQLQFGAPDIRIISSSSRLTSTRTVTTTVSKQQQSGQAWFQSEPTFSSKIITTTTRTISADPSDVGSSAPSGEKKQASNMLLQTTNNNGNHLVTSTNYGLGQVAPDGNQSHYNENILMRFATEHANDNNKHYRPNTTTTVAAAASPATSYSNYQRSTLGGKTSTPNERVKQERADAGRSSTLPGKHLTGAAAEQPRQIHQAPAPQLAVGKFVNYYPAERQPSRPSSPQRNYSFHVPLAHSSASQAQAGWQSRYGFVAPLERIKSNPGDASPAAPVARRAQPAGWSSSFKSRTISHLPDMVRLSVDDTTPVRRSRARELEGQQNYQDPYEQQLQQLQATPRATLGRSEGDLLRAHRVSLARLEPGSDNPFRPGTELSWEADLMVRLMKRGYPLDELPTLVQSAKQVAATDRERTSTSQAPSKAATLGRAAAADKPEDASMKRQTSIADLNSDTRRAWASSLSRARSMPRGFGLASQLSGSSADYKSPKALKAADADSIDRLISNIEDELQQIQLTKGPNNQTIVTSTSLSPTKAVSSSKSSYPKSSTSKTKTKVLRRTTRQASSAEQDLNLRLVEERKSRSCCRIH